MTRWGVLRNRWLDFRYGRLSGYPLCCVLRFSLSRFRFQGARRGFVHNEGKIYVPCGVFHHTDGRYRWGWGLDLNKRYGDWGFKTTRKNYLSERANG